jgi:hypothetical protein
MSKSIQVYIDSTYAMAGYTSNFSYFLKEPIRNAKSFKITSAEIPLSFYNIRSSGIDANNTFIFSETNGTTTTTATVTAGYYTSTSIITALQTAMNTASPNFYTYTITYNTTIGKFIISATGNFKVMYNSSSTSTGWLSINWVLGYNQVSNTNSNLQAGQTSPFLDYYQYFYVRIGLNFNGNFDEMGNKNSIIKIPITNPQGAIQYYFDVSDNRFDILSTGGDNPISAFNLQLLDSDYYEVNLNGRQVSYTLTFYYD